MSQSQCISRGVIIQAVEFIPCVRHQPNPSLRLSWSRLHDSRICYIVPLLSTHPEALAKLRREHDEVLGTELAKAPALLKSQPHVTNNLLYTTAVIKECLRLYPPGSCSRLGQATVSLVSDSGKHCPTEHVEAAFTIHSELHRSPAYWVEPDAFIPERWLVEHDHRLSPIKGAYRAFEIGPRNCVAQGLAMTELKAVIAMLVRQFDFRPAYEEWDRLHPPKRSKIRTYRGDRVYQIEEGAAHCPCRVALRGGQEGQGRKV